MRSLRSIVGAAILLLISSQAFALPRFTAMAEQKCNLCHVNPTGGGMRNSYGSQYFAQTEMAVHKVALERITDFQPNVSDNISLGMDMRSLYIYNEDAKQSTLFQMEGNFYLSAQVTDKIAMATSRDLNGVYDIYGMGYYLPHKGYFKVGKFQPSYGWRFADHTSFVRERMLWTSTYYDTGIEFGLYPYGISANLGIFNGSGGQLDDNQGKAMAFRIEGRKHLNQFGFGLGGSYWRNDREASTVDMYGPFFYINAFKGRIIHIGEFDWLKDHSTDITAFATTQKLALQITQGVWIEAQYDFQDPDVDLKSGRVSRFVFSIDYFPIGFLEVTPTVRFYDDELSNRNYTDFIQQFHFFF